VRAALTWDKNGKALFRPGVQDAGGWQPSFNYTLKRWAELTRFLDHPVHRAIHELGGEFDEANCDWKAKLVAFGKQGSRPQDRGHLQHR
jgi:hypothetical protein